MFWVERIRARRHWEVNRKIGTELSTVETMNEITRRFSYLNGRRTEEAVIDSRWELDMVRGQLTVQMCKRVTSDKL